MSGLKRRDDRFNRRAHLAERLTKASSVGWRPLVEDYVYGDVRIHVHDLWHYQARSGLDYTANLCATFEWPRCSLTRDVQADVVGESAQRGWREGVGQLDGRVDQMKVAMLVDLPEFLKHREGFAVGGVLPCRKWLQSLDVCDEVLVNGPEFLSRSGLPVLRIPHDRERNVAPSTLWGDWAGRRATLGLAQGKDEMVERRTEIVDHISEDRSPLRGGGFPPGFRPDDYLAGLFVELRVNAIGVRRELGLGSIQCSQVRLSSPHLGAGSPQ